jgi:hypothetical protein
LVIVDLVVVIRVQYSGGNDEIFGGHSQAEDGFQDDELGSPGLQLREARQ